MDLERKQLDSLSPQQLSGLFPISIVEHSTEWKLCFEKERDELKRILGERAIRIEHFGSTAIPNIKAKPTIDILVEIPKNKRVKLNIIKVMELEGYHFIPQNNDNLPPYLLFVKGYTIQGFKGQAFHIYMAEKEHSGLWDRLYFRNYLIENKDIREEYEALKVKLAQIHENDRETYTEGKTDFVKKITEMAKKKFYFRYYNCFLLTNK